MEAGFSTTLPRMVVTISLTGIRAPPGRQINGKVISQGTIGFTGHRCGIHCGLVKKSHLFGQFGIRRSSLMNGEHALHRHQFPSNVFFAYLTPVSQSNINFGIAFKLDGHGDGPPILHMNFGGLDLATMIASNGSKWCLGKEFPKDMEK